MRAPVGPSHDCRTLVVNSPTTVVRWRDEVDEANGSDESDHRGARDVRWGSVGGGRRQPGPGRHRVREGARSTRVGAVGLPGRPRSGRTGGPAHGAPGDDELLARGRPPVSYTHLTLPTIYSV